MSFKTPVAVFFYNRPHLLTQVLSTLREVKPTNIYFFADGPKDARDAELCHQARELEALIDWPCEIHRDYALNNMGCALRVSSGLTALFSACDEAIVLEDDTVPAPDFFPYCESLLKKYRHDEKIFQIGGSAISGKLPIRTSYTYSKHPLPPWGWATWARAWKHYDFELSFWQKEKKRILTYLGSEAPYWSHIIETFLRHLETWDLQWAVAHWKNQALSIVPRENLVTNIGYGPEATFTSFEKSPFKELQAHTLQGLSHPLSQIPEADPVLFPLLQQLLEEIGQRKVQLELLDAS